MNHQDQYGMAKRAVRFRGIPVFANAERLVPEVEKMMIQNGARPGGLTSLAAKEQAEQISRQPGIWGSNIGNNAIWVNRKAIPGREDLREALAHEAGHNHPVLGDSESFARFMGGVARQRGAAFPTRMLDGLRSMRNYYRPSVYRAYQDRPVQRLWNTVSQNLIQPIKNNYQEMAHYVSPRNVFRESRPKTGLDAWGEL